MMKTREEILQVVREFHQRLVSIYGVRLKGVYLFGSYAREEADEDSDIDIAIVLESLVKRNEELRRISELRSALSLQHNVVLMPFFLSEEEFHTPPEAIFRHIVNEGVMV